MDHAQTLQPWTSRATISTNTLLFRHAYIWKVDLFVLFDILGDLVDLVCDILWSWSTVRSVELDTEIIVWSSWIVRSGQQDTSVGLEGSNQGRDSRGGQDGVLTNDDVLDTVTGSELKDDLRGFR